jgi:hypothetical protein
MDIDDFLSAEAKADPKPEKQPEPAIDKWAEIIKPCTSNLIVGDVGTGKTGLGMYLLDRFSQHYNLRPIVVGFPQAKRKDLPEHFDILDNCEDVTKIENAILFIDEADLQLPIEDTKARKYVTNFLSLPRHRSQVLLLAFHFPRLILGRYLPFFATFMLKRPPYLLEFAGKSKGDTLVAMMQKAEERFAELPDPGLVNKNTYVIAPRIRWQGMLENPLANFWSDDLSKAWSGIAIETPVVEPAQVAMPIDPGDGGIREPSSVVAERLIEELSDDQLRYALGLVTEVTDDAMTRMREYAHYPKYKLQEMLAERGLSTSGLHIHLAARLASKEA